MLQVLALLIVGPLAVSQPQDEDRVSLVTQTRMDEIIDISISPSGDRFLTHEWNVSTPRLWDRETMRVLRVLEVSRGRGPRRRFGLSWVEFTPDGEHVVYNSESEIRVWDSTFGRELAVHTAQSQAYWRSTISPDSSYFAVGTVSGAIEVFTLPDLELINTFEGHEEEAVNLEFSPDGTRLTSTSYDETVRIWNLLTGEWRMFQNPSEGLRVAGFSGDGKYVLMNSLDEARMYDTESGEFVRFAAPAMEWAWFVGENRDQVLVRGEDGAMTVYALDGQVVGELKGHAEDYSIASFSSDRTRVATSDDEGFIIWDLIEFRGMLINVGTKEHTAAAFTPDGTEFWLAMADGSIRPYDTDTGEFDGGTEVVTVPEVKTVVSPSGRWIYCSTDVLGSPETEPEAWIIDVYNPSERREIGLVHGPPEWSADETRMIWQVEGEQIVILYDVFRGEVIKRFDDYCAGAKMSSAGDTFVTWHFTGEVYLWDVSDGEEIAGFTLENAGVNGHAAFHPTDSLIVTTNLDHNKVIVFDYRTRAINLDVDLDERALIGNQVQFSPDGSRFAMVDDDGLRVWEYPSGNPVLHHAFDNSISFIEQTEFSPDGSMISVKSTMYTIILDVATGEELKRLQSLGSQWSNVEWSPNGLVTTYDNRDGWRVFVWNPRQEDPLLEIRASSELSATQFSPDGNRLFTMDSTDGLTVWDLSGTDDLSAERVGSFVYMNGGESWLTWEETGRFDASDPNAVEGAHFLLEWSDGLEVVDVSQLKERYYDPGLLAKILGLDADPRRSVPQIDDLRMFPDVSLSSGGSPMELQVEVTERDAGGVGDLQMWINGKRVYTRDDPPGYFTVDLTRYEQYFLPQNLLQEGQGNVVSVTVSNGRGTLTSPPMSIDVGVPEGLKTPDVRLFGLFVGIGDYVGTVKDLEAPPNDAKILEEAVRTVAESLLPGRVETTLMSAAPGQQDSATRVDILAWFAETAQKATSSDIVMVFLSGHGVNRIAGQEDYYFLTPEADPANVGVLSIESATVSGSQISELLSSIPAAKQILILDTCHSGAVAQPLLAKSRSVGGDYRRAWEAMRDATGTWLLAGSAANQYSYEAPNVGHGVLTYALLEAIDQGSSEALREGDAGRLFVDVERWLSYASYRVESLKNEIGILGIQRPQFTRASSGTSFDIGVMKEDERGFLDIKPPMPIVVVGEFDFDTEDPLQLETLVRTAMFESQNVKTWRGVTAHRGVYRVAARYSVDGSSVKVSVFVQQFDDAGNRKTLERFELLGLTTSLGVLAKQVRDESVRRILQLDRSEKTAG